VGRRKSKERILERIEVIDLGDKGRAIGKAEDGRIVLVEKAVPGDVIRGRRVQRKKGMWIMVPMEFHERSGHRAEPFCRHFGTCGGCKWQNLEYERQLFYKQKGVEDALTRIAHLESPEILPILGCAETQYYRNKLEYTFSDKRWLTLEQINSGEDFDRNGLGFHVPGQFDKVLDIEKCYLQPDPSDVIRLRVRELALQNDITFQNIREREGLLRNLVIRNNLEGEVQVILVMKSDDKDARDYILGTLVSEFPQIVSAYYCINPKLNDTTFDLPMELFSGSPHLRQSLGEVKFDLGPKSFFQTNPKQARALFDIAVAFAEIQPADLVFDLYCGIGSITLYIADKARHVLGVEEVPEAIDDAKRNAQLNGISNVDFFSGDAREVVLTDEFNKFGSPDIVITDPPRAGMHESVVQSLIKMAPRRIVYVSCNPSTQARDIALLSEAYTFVKARPVDMFPHTSHIENVAVLERK